MKQTWKVSLEDKSTREQWEVHVIVEPPMAQLNAEVSAIKAAQVTLGKGNVRCTHSSFVRDEP